MRKLVIKIAKNIGKVFEDNWKKSCPDSLLVYRPPDAAQSFNPNSKLRFSAHSPCDYMMFDSNTSIFYTLELKSCGNGSFSFSQDDKIEKGKMIKKHQIDSLLKFSTYKKVVSGFLLDFRDSDNTYFVDIGRFIEMIDRIDKKSFNEKDLLYLCDPLIIEKKQLRINYRYDIEKFLNVISSNVKFKDKKEK